MSSELSIAEQSDDYSANFNFTLCDLPELENVTELQSYCRSMLPPAEGDGGGGGPPTYVMTVIQIFYALVCICGLVGNSLVIYVVLR